MSMKLNDILSSKRKGFFEIDGKTTIDDSFIFIIKYPEMCITRSRTKTRDYFRNFSSARA